MLKYLYQKEVFSEIPGEITLGISLSGCTIRCKGCHSQELWEDKGEPLDWKCLEGLIKQHRGITCVLLLGGEHDLDALTELFYRAHKIIKTAWYCGLDKVPKKHLGIYRFLDYIKLGHFDEKLGPLTSPTTNQALYKLEHQGDGNYYEHNITELLQHEDKSKGINTGLNA